MHENMCSPQIKKLCDILAEAAARGDTTWLFRATEQKQLKLYISTVGNHSVSW